MMNIESKWIEGVLVVVKNSAYHKRKGHLTA